MYKFDNPQNSNHLTPLTSNPNVNSNRKFTNNNRNSMSSMQKVRSTSIFGRPSTTTGDSMFRSSSFTRKSSTAIDNADFAQSLLLDKVQQRQGRASRRSNPSPIPRLILDGFDDESNSGELTPSLSVDDNSPSPRQQQSYKNRRPSTSNSPMLLLSPPPINADTSNNNERTEQLRDEVKLLQLAMIDKFRGKNRFTGGSQFRSKPVANVTENADTSNLKNTVKNLRKELKALKLECEEAENYSNSEKTTRYLVEEELRKEHIESNNLRNQLEREGKSEVLLVQTLKNRLETEKQDTGGLLESKDMLTASLQKRSDELDEIGLRYEVEKEQWTNERRRLQAEIDSWRQRSMDAISSGKEEATKNETNLREVARSATYEKEAEVKKLIEASAKLKELEAQHSREKRNSLAADSKAEKLVLEIARLELLVEQRDKSLIDCAERERGLKEDLKRTEEVEDVSNIKYEGLLEELKNATEELRVSTVDKASLDAKLQKRSGEVALLEGKITKERRTHKQNIEQALSSIVRLCVVAPTVNIQMTDQTMMIKAPLPKEKIRQFVQGQVLPKFATIFEQSADGKAPDAVTSLDIWLQTLLVDMQGTIEKHLTKVFSEEVGEGVGEE